MNNQLLLATALTALLATPAVAADAMVAATEYPVIYEDPSYNWTGFYAGVMGGAAGGDFDFDIDDFDIGFGVTAGGLLGGVQVGADYQIDNFVVGVVADIAATNITGGINADLGGLGELDINSRLTYLGTLRARLGYAMD